MSRARTVTSVLLLAGFLALLVLAVTGCQDNKQGRDGWCQLPNAQGCPS